MKFIFAGDQVGAIICANAHNVVRNVQILINAECSDDAGAIMWQMCQQKCIVESKNKNGKGKSRQLHFRNVIGSKSMRQHG